MKKTNLIIVLFLGTSIIGALLKIYKVEFANLFLGISVITLFIGIYFFFKKNES